MQLRAHASAQESKSGSPARSRVLVARAFRAGDKSQTGTEAGPENPSFCKKAVGKAKGAAGLESEMDRGLQES